MKTSSSPPHFPELDILRVLAILLIVYGHSFYTVWSLDGGFIELADSPRLHTNLYRCFYAFLGWIFTFHLPLFFILAGICYQITERSYPHFSILLKKKARRLLLPCFATGIFFMLPIKYLAGFYNKETIGSALFSFLTVTNAYGHLWFLLALFWIFLFFYILRQLLHLPDLLLLLISGGFYFWGTANIYYALPSNAGYIAFGLGYFFWFTIGAMFQKYNCRKYWQGKNAWLQFGLWTVFSVGNFIAGGSPPAIGILLGSLTLYSLSFLLAEHSRLLQKKWFQILLHYNFYIYLFHDPLNYLILAAAIHLQLLNTVQGTILYQALRLLGTSLSAIAAAHLLEKIFLWKRNRL